MMGCLPLYVLASLLSGVAAAQKGFLLTLPKQPRIGYPEKMCMTFHNLSSPVEVTLTLRNQRKTFLETIAGFDELSGCVTLTIPRKASSPNLELQVQGRDSSGHVLRADQRLTPAAAPWTTLILLDRSVYTAGDTVRFRVLTHDPDLLPYLGPIHQIVLFDPRMTTMKQWSPRWTQVVSKNGFAEFQFPLASTVVSGSWTVRVQISGQKAVVKRFLVLPIMEADYHVEVQAPAFLPVTASVVEVTACLRDAEGRKRRGHVRLEATLVNSFRFPWATRASLKRPTAVLNDDLQGDGCSRLAFNTSVLGLSDARYSLNGAQLALTTSVKVPGEQEAIIREDMRRVAVTHTDARFDNSSPCGSFFKPGLPFDVKFLLRRLDGFPMAGAGVRVTSPELGLDATLTTDDQGSVRHNVPVMPTGLPAVTFTAQPVGPRYSAPGRGHYGLLAPSVNVTAVREQSPSHSFLYIAPQPVPLPCNASLMLEVYASNPPRDGFFLHSQLTTRGSLLFVEVERIDPIHIHSMHKVTYADGAAGGNSSGLTLQTSLFRVRLNMDASFAPVAHLLLYYVTSAGEVVADTLTMPIKPCNSDLVSLDLGASQAVPGEQLEVRVTGPPRAACALGVSDFPPGLPPHLDSLLHPQAFWDSYQAAFSQHQWCASTPPCASPGSGRDSGRENVDAHLAFQMAGLTVMSDLQVGRGCLPSVALLANTSSTSSSSSSQAAASRREDVSPVRASTRKKRDVIRFFAETLPSPDNDKPKNRRKPSSPKQPKGSRGTPRPRLPGRPGSRPPSARGKPRPSRKPKPSPSSRSPARGSRAKKPKSRPSKSRSRSNRRRKGRQRGARPVSSGPSMLVRHLLTQRYPDTWLWEMLTVRRNGAAAANVTVPPRQTAWRGVAVCVGGAGRANLAVSPPASLNVSPPLQAWLHLPPSAMVGERLQVTASVYTPLARCLQVAVWVEGGEGVALERDWQSTVCVCQAERQTAVFNIAVMDVGVLSLTVKAKASEPDPQHCPHLQPSPDPLPPQYEASFSLPVTTVGKETGYSTSLWLCPSNAGDRPSKVLDLNLPMDAVPGSGRVQLSVSGHVLAPSLGGVGALVEGGRGAGAEWALSSFSSASALFYALSMGPLHTLPPRASRSLKTTLLEGYQRIQTYRHPDGSYSAFGRPGDVGSTWLTAYVVRSLSQAGALLTLDRRSLTRSAKWLLSRQTEDRGCFQEKGKVVGKYFQGYEDGQSSEVTLTAHVLLALLEVGIKADTPALLKARSCVTRSPISDVYTLALSTYLLTRIHNRDPTIGQFLPHLLDVAVVTGEGTPEAEMHWERAGEREHWREYSPFPRARAVDVETTSYVLLALTSLSDVDIKQVNSIVRWLLRQRNHLGGFISSQDTVVAIQALALYTSLTYSGPPNLKVMIQGHMIDRSLQVAYENTLELQQLNLSAPNSLSIGADGHGCALAQVSVRWTSVAVPPSTSPLSIRVQVGPSRQRPQDCARRSLLTCIGYKGAGNHSGLVALTVKLATGWTPDVRELSQRMYRRKNEFDYFEVDPEHKDMIHFYFLEMEWPLRCVQWEATERVHVDGHKQAYATARDVYRPDLTTRTFYTMHTDQPCSSPHDTDAENDRPPESETAPQPATPAPTPPQTPAPDPSVPQASRASRAARDVPDQRLAQVRLFGQGRPPRRRVISRRPIFSSIPFQGMETRGRSEHAIMEGQVRCPVCRKLRPAELVTAFCTAQAAYKVAMLGSRDNTVKVLSDMRRNPKNVLNRVASLRVPPDCVCPFLQWKRGVLLVLSLHPNSSSRKSQSARRPLQVSALSHVTSLYKRQGRLLERVKRTGKCERIP